MRCDSPIGLHSATARASTARARFAVTTEEVRAFENSASGDRASCRAGQRDLRLDVSPGGIVNASLVTDAVELRDIFTLPASTPHERCKQLRHQSLPISPSESVYSVLRRPKTTFSHTFLKKNSATRKLLDFTEICRAPRVVEPLPRALQREV